MIGLSQLGSTWLGYSDASAIDTEVFEQATVLTSCLIGEEQLGHSCATGGDSIAVEQVESVVLSCIAGSVATIQIEELVSVDSLGDQSIPGIHLYDTANIELTGAQGTLATIGVTEQSPSIQFTGLHGELATVAVAEEAEITIDSMRGNPASMAVVQTDSFELNRSGEFATMGVVESPALDIASAILGFATTEFVEESELWLNSLNGSVATIAVTEQASVSFEQASSTLGVSEDAEISIEGIGGTVATISVEIEANGSFTGLSGSIATIVVSESELVGVEGDTGSVASVAVFDSEKTSIAGVTGGKATISVTGKSGVEINAASSNVATIQVAEESSVVFEQARHELSILEASEVAMLAVAGAVATIAVAEEHAVSCEGRTGTAAVSSVQEDATVSADSEVGTTATMACADEVLVGFIGITGTVSQIVVAQDDKVELSAASENTAAIRVVQDDDILFSGKTTFIAQATEDPTAWAMNSENFAFTDYDNYRFMCLGQSDEMALGAMADGIYSLVADDDAGKAISSELLSGQDDGDSEQLKRCPLIHADITGNAALIIEVDDTLHTIPYNNLRGKPGRGLRGNRLAFGVKSSERVTIRAIEPFIEVNRKRA